MRTIEKICVGELFAGIGGIARGLESTGHYETAWLAEIDSYCQEILQKHWPGTPVYGDVKQVDWNKAEAVDMLAGGYPCQPSSVTGRRKGRGDERWLWPEFARAIGILRPRFVFVENVPGLLSVNGGEAFGEMVGSLAGLGYNAEWTIIPAASVGAPHLRKRVFLVAWRRVPDSESPRGRAGAGSVPAYVADEKGRATKQGFKSVRCGATPANTPSRENHGRERSKLDATAQIGGSGNAAAGIGRETACRSIPVIFARPPETSRFWQIWHKQPIAEIAAALCRVDDGLPARLHPAHRRSRLQALGNAVVVQVAAHVGQLVWEAGERGEV